MYIYRRKEYLVDSLILTCEGIAPTSSSPGATTSIFFSEGTFAVTSKAVSHCSLRNICFMSLNRIPCILGTTWKQNKNPLIKSNEKEIL